MTENECAAVIDRLLRDDVQPAAEEMAHIRACATCLSVIEKANALSAMIEARGEHGRDAGTLLLASTEAVAATEVRRRSAALVVTQALVATIALAGASFWFVVGGFYLGKSHIVESRAEFLLSGLPVLFVVSIALGTVLGLSLARLRRGNAPPVALRRGAVVVPLAFTAAFAVEYRLAEFLAGDMPAAFGWAIGAFIITAALAAYLAGAVGLPYKRLRRGRLLSGVCLGIAEQTRLPVSLVRLLFIVLALGKMFGVVLYVILDLLMEVHPDDRASLLRFRIRRWWHSRRQSAASPTE